MTEAEAAKDGAEELSATAGDDAAGGVALPRDWERSLAPGAGERRVDRPAPRPDLPGPAFRGHVAGATLRRPSPVPRASARAADRLSEVPHLARAADGREARRVVREAQGGLSQHAVQEGEAQGPTQGAGREVEGQLPLPPTAGLPAPAVHGRGRAPQADHVRTPGPRLLHDLALLRLARQPQPPRNREAVGRRVLAPARLGGRARHGCSSSTRTGA